MENCIARNKSFDINSKYTPRFPSDKHESEEEEEPNLWKTFAIFWDVVNNRNLQTWFLFNVICKAACSINNNIADSIGFILNILSIVFSQIIKIRYFLYDKRLLKNSPLGCLVIVVGNITVGGTGKTPVVEKLANFSWHDH